MFMSLFVFPLVPLLIGALLFLCTIDAFLCLPIQITVKRFLFILGDVYSTSSNDNTVYQDTVFNIFDALFRLLD